MFLGSTTHVTSQVRHSGSSVASNSCTLGVGERRMTVARIRRSGRVPKVLRSMVEKAYLI
jgi:hypothetical protein